MQLHIPDGDDDGDGGRKSEVHPLRMGDRRIYSTEATLYYLGGILLEVSSTVLSTVSPNKMTDQSKR